MIWQSRYLNIASLIIGALGGFAFSPYGLWFLFFLSISGLIFILKDCLFGEGLKRYGIWLLGFSAVHFYWITVALSAEWATFWWIAPFAFLMIPLAFMILYVGTLAFIMTIFRFFRFHTPYFLWIFVLSWTLAEWIRSTFIFGGFPWNLTAHVWVHTPFMFYGASLLGAQTLGMLTMALAVLPTLIFLNPFRMRPILYWHCLGILSCIGLWLWQSITTDTITTQPDIWIRLVQPNFPAKRQQSGYEELLQLQKLTHLPSKKPITHVVWPEGAFPQINGSAQEILENTLRKNQMLITGLLRRSGPDYYNSLVVLSTDAEVRAIYDKAHLAPFGEYLPGRSVFQTLCRGKKVRALTLDTQDFQKGPPAETVSVEKTPPFIPQICFDIAFPDSPKKDEKPTWVLELTNDAWFYKSWGLFQHLTIARMKAVETGLPVIRCTNTGITSLLSPDGSILEKLPIQTEGVLDVALPSCFSSPPAYYLGSTLFYILWLIIFSFSLYFSFRRTEKSKKK